MNDQTNTDSSGYPTLNTKTILKHKSNAMLNAFGILCLRSKQQYLLALKLNRLLMLTAVCWIHTPLTFLIHMQRLYFQ